MRMSSSRLWKFSSDVTYWELLLVIYKHKGNPEFGITDYIDQLKTRRQSLLTIRNFIRDRIADADFLIVPAVKKSRKALTLNDPLRRELEQYFFGSHLATSVPSQLLLHIPKTDLDGVSEPV
ncbi:MAG: hypothetical protein NXI27_31470 [Alphaproteobacteria bacterium]|nr:hypothetical protein [Alphaproteobacteria bacterium]